MPLYLVFPLTLLATALYFIVMAFVVVRMRPDYFIREDDDPSFRDRYPIMWFVSKVIKNLIGTVLILAGIIMLFLPGQGLLTILMGLFFTDFPGKRKLERSLVKQPTVWNSINWIRKKANKPPIDPIP